MPSEVEIGVWVEGTQKWVTGVSKRTSCHDIIKALLRAQNLSALDAEVNKFVIVEKWRKMERPLDHEQRILKVWKTWGDAIQEVRFSLRRVKSEDDKSDSDTGSRVERSRRRHKWRQANSAHSKGHISSTAGHISTSTLAGKKAPEDEAVVSDTMERLMRLVVAQGETIQTQLRRMHERDQQIEDFEHQLHFLRVQSLGSDYLLHSYLQEPLQDRNSSSSHQDSNSFTKDDVPCEEKSNDSGVVTEELSDLVPEKRHRSTSRDRKGSSHNKNNKDTVEEVKAKTHLLDQLDDVLTKLLEQEEELARLEESLAETTNLQMSHLKAEITMATKVHASAVTSSRQNELQLRELDTVLYQRRLALESLLEEDAQYEKEVIALQAHLDYIIHLPPTAFKLSDGSQSIPPPPPAFPLGPGSVNSTTTVQAPFLKGGGSLLNLQETEKGTETSLSSSKINIHEQSSLKSILRSHPSRPDIVIPPPLPLIPPPLPSSSPPPLDDEDDDKDSGQTSSLCVSSSSSTSSESSPCQGSSAAKLSSTKISKGAHPHSHKDSDSTDSNSDTGLSSLHSSSDEGAYVLNTLV